MSALIQTPTVFSSYNARFDDEEDLSKAFVPSDDFATVIAPGHTLILGPRGSGKTCLLKMMEPASLGNWNGEEAEGFKMLQTFVGVYVPTDVSWREQLKNLGGTKLTLNQQVRLEQAALAAHILQSFVRTLLQCVSAKTLQPWGRLDVTFEKEREICTTLASRWEVRLPTPTFQALKLAISARAIDIWRFAKRESLLPEDGRDLRFASECFVDRDFLQEFIFASNVVNTVTDEPNRRWALLFDELEIAPNWLLKALLDALRSSDQRLYLKLSLAPFCQTEILEGALTARTGNDFQVVRLWYKHKRSGREFCFRLMTSLLARSQLSSYDIYTVFGYSRLKGGRPNRGTAYSPGSSHHKLLLQAYRDDSDFRDYCDSNAIDLNAIDKLAEAERASLIRKIVPVLMVRQEFRKPDESADDGVKKRSKKKTDIYSGADTFFEVLEGNPRWIIGITNQLLPEVLKRGRVSPRLQFDRLVDTATGFLAILNTVPLSLEMPSVSLADLLEKIAKKIHASVVTDVFTPEPYGSFEIDSAVPESVLDALGVALNAGAIIGLDDDTSDLLVKKRLVGKTYRLTYLLSPYYRIPVRVGRSFPLSQLLTPSASKVVAKKVRAERPSSSGVQPEFKLEP